MFDCSVLLESLRQPFSPTYKPPIITAMKIINVMEENLFLIKKFCCILTYKVNFKNTFQKYLKILPIMKLNIEKSMP